MTDGDDMDLGRGGDDLLAAEYVLGVLDAEARGRAARRIDEDAAFARLVDQWEVHLSPLAGAYGEVAPPEAVKQRLDARLFANRSQPAVARPSGFMQSLAFWRGLAAAALAALVVYVAASLLPVDQAAPQRLVASLASEETDVRFLALYDSASGEIALSRVAGEPGAAEDYELWVIRGDDAPASLGVIPQGDTIVLAADDATRERIASGSLFAISLEPEGGSPTGAPTGPVLAAGDLRAI